MTSPWEWLREAAEAVVGGYIREHYKKVAGHFEFTVLARDARKLVEALAALPATPPEQPSSDAERERAIEALLQASEKFCEHDSALQEAHDAVRIAERNAAKLPPHEERIEEWERYAHRVLGLDLTSNDFHRHVVSWAKRLMRSAPAPQPVRVAGKEFAPCAKCGTLREEKPVPAPPASDWRERFGQQHKSARENKSKMLQWEEPVGFTSHAVDFADDVICALAAMHDGLAALEAEVAKLKEKP